MLRDLGYLAILVLIALVILLPVAKRLAPPIEPEWPMEIQMADMEPSIAPEIPQDRPFRLVQSAPHDWEREGWA